MGSAVTSLVDDNNLCQISHTRRCAAKKKSLFHIESDF